MSYFTGTETALIFERRNEIVRIETWGPDAFRVRATKNTEFISENWALDETPEHIPAQIRILDGEAFITNGKITARLNAYGKITFTNQKDEILLKEYYRSWDFGCENWEDIDQITQEKVAARTYKAIVGTNSYKIDQYFIARDDERIYGMGQYQHPYLNLKGCDLDLAQKNTQASVPFMISSLGYGFLWNNPAVGTVSFAKNKTRWSARTSEQIEYWITAGDTPREIEEKYANVTGKVPMMPEHGLGFWQCKLRYWNQEEVLRVSRGYKERGIPVDVMVVDFFHWTEQGDWQFDPQYWPDPEGMVKELQDMGMKLMVSVWPTVDRNSIHYEEMMDQGLLVRTERGVPVTMECYGFEQFMDPTNPKTREYVFNVCKENYLDKGVTLFWLDEAEPEYSEPDFEYYRYYKGNALTCANIYPRDYARIFYDGMKKLGNENPMNLVRCAWAGSQKYGALAWSGDVPSTFTYLRYQMQAGLNMGLAGMPWWTADIGGFHGADITDPKFHELLIRWFQFGAFCPVMRLHGDRNPHKKTAGAPRGGGMVSTGADNEIWSYTPEVETIMSDYILRRDRLRPYIREAMQEAHELGTPVIKPVFYDFPDDKAAWTVEDQYLFGHDILVAPVLKENARSRSVYLPAGSTWTDPRDGKIYEGGQTITVEAPIEWMPIFVKDGRDLPIMYPIQ